MSETLSPSLEQVNTWRERYRNAARVEGGDTAQLVFQASLHPELSKLNSERFLEGAAVIVAFACSSGREKTEEELKKVLSEISETARLPQEELNEELRLLVTNGVLKSGEEHNKRRTKVLKSLTI